MLEVIKEVIEERKRQDGLWGEQNHHPLEWLSILGEEFGEVCKGAYEAHFDGHKISGNYSEYRKELIHVAAVAIAAAESLDRQESNEFT